jgi:TolB protein
VDLYVINFGAPKPRRLTRGIAVEASPAWSPDGHRLVYVSDEASPGRPRLYIINRNGTSKQQLPSIGNDAVTPDWSKDNKIVYATRVNGFYTLAVLDLISGKNSRVTEIPGNYESPSWAADNRQVVCKREYNGKSELCVVDTWTGKVRRLLFTPYPLSMPSWSPCPVR